ncbi:MAG TPA: hypothetical protein VHZ98_13955 [Galbitalea sp.]|nr:hypothetical protein [Galbitalea sp.]
MGVPLEQQFACLAELRRELTASYPSVLSDRLLRIARKYGLDRFPEGFLVSGALADPGPSGARAALRQIRRNTPGHDGTFHPLFSNEFYRLCNPDVASSRVPPWVHYQVFGRAENRTPHPLIDVSHLAAWFPETSRGAILDEYLMRPSAWTADPGPYVDCQKFLLHGNWDGTTNPLVQIVRGRLIEPWVHQRLLLVDTSSGTPASARLTGIGYLLSRSTARSRLSSVETWSAVPDPSPTLPATVMVVPGFFAGVAGHAVAVPSASMVSPDTTVIALPTEFLSVVSGATLPAPALRFIDRALAHGELRTLVRTAPSGAAIAPFSAAQDVALQELVLHENRSDLIVLGYGIQIRVTTDTLSVAEQVTSVPPTPVWEAREERATDLAFVFAPGEASLLISDARVAAAVRAGAAVCILEFGSVAAWMPVLGERSIVVCSSTTMTDVLAFVDRGRVALFDQGDGASA